MTAPLFPMFVDLNDRPVVVVGGGAVARRKTTALLEAGARVITIAPTLDPELARLAREGHIRHVSGRFDPSWLEGVWLVVAATDSVRTNRLVAAAARARRIWTNVVDDVELSSFHVPARVQRGKVQVAISSGGAAPMLARHLRETLETQLDESLGALAELFAQLRERIRLELPDLQARRGFFQRVLDGPAPTLARRGDLAGARRRMLSELRSSSKTRATGRVSLVGAGPGDPGLLTLRGLRVLNQADIVLHDRLVTPEVLALVRRDAEFIEVGKQAGNHHVTQERIHALMLEHARAGRHVVRLKGGDAFVFGRGGEELEFLRAHGIAFEVVPGITAALACGAYAGIPLTHRKHAQSVRFVTAHCQDSVDALDWAGLAAEQQTLAIYMGVAGLGVLRDRLLAHGRAASTPVALVENGSRPEQRVITGTLAHLPEIAIAHDVRSPALLFIGEVAALAKRLHWFGSPPIDTCHRNARPTQAATSPAPREQAA